MLKSILVVVDGSKVSEHAQDVAIELAKEKKANLTGVGILDIPWITAAQPEPLGGTAYKIHRDDEIISQSHKHVVFLLNEFKNACKTAKIKSKTIELEGLPANEIETLSHEHDIIAIGQTTAFHFGLEEDSNITVKHIARDNPRPLLVVPPNKKDGKNIIVAYDGSTQSSKALHMFLLLGLGINKEVHIVSVDEDKNEATDIAMQALRMCSTYNINPTIHAVKSKEKPEEIILKKAEKYSAKMIVMGAFSHTTFLNVLFGSCTTTLMKKCPIPLFIYH